MSTCLDELDVINDRWKKLNAEFLKNDGKIDSDEEERLNNISVKWQRAMRACMAKSQEKIDKTAADAGARFKVDPSQLKVFKEYVQKVMSTRAQVAAADVLNVLLAYPPPADAKASKDLREKIRQSFSKLDDAEKMAIGRELNKLGIYIPSLKEDAPGAEDATARIKKMHVSGDFVDSSGNIDPVQADYVRGLILQAKKQGFKLVIQIERGKFPIAPLMSHFATKTGIAEADLPTFVEFLEADKDDYIWSEDNKWISVDGSTIHASPDISNATNSRLKAFTSHKAARPGDVREGHHSAGEDNTDTPDEARPGGMVPEGAYQGAVDRHEYGQPWWDPKYRNLSADALGRATGKNVIKNHTYNEGGNMVVGTKPDGQPYAMIGRDGLLVSLFHIQEEFENETDPRKKKAHEFSPDNVKSRRDEMDKKGFDPDELAATKKRLEYIYSNPQTLAPLPAGASDAEKRAYALYKADFEKSKKQFDQEKAEFNKDQDEFTKRFLAKLDITKDIFEKETKVPRKDLIFIPQPDFHIDMHMRPVAPGQVMVNDFQKNIDLIDEALALATKPSWEEKQLLTMKENAKRSQKAMEPVIKEIKKQLEAKGLTVISAPGVMEADMEPFLADPGAAANSISKKVATDLGLAAPASFTRKELGQAYKAKFAGSPNPPDIGDLLDKIFTRHANFMNAIPGTKEGTNEQFYMTNATSIKPLQTAYEAYLKKNGVENVEWIGDTGGGEFDRTESEWSLQGSGGLDCRENH